MAHTISGTFSVEDSQNVLFIATYMLQFHNIGRISKQMPCRFPLLHVRNQKITHVGLANHRCRTRTNFLIAAMRMRSLLLTYSMVQSPS